MAKAKDRLVSRGFKQKHAMGYLEIFSPAANTSIHVIVAFACKFDFE